MNYYNVYIDGEIVSKITNENVNREIKKLIRKNYQVFDCRKKDLVVFNFIGEDQDIALIGRDKKRKKPKENL